LGFERNPHKVVGGKLKLNFNRCRLILKYIDTEEAVIGKPQVKG